MKAGLARSELTLKQAVTLAESRTVISSLSPAIDFLLGGGYKTGELVEVFGASNTGKTQLAVQAALSAAMGGSTVAFVDTESSFRPERLALMAELRGVDREAVLSRVFCVRATNSQEQLESTALVRKDENVRESKLVVVDTVSKNFVLEYGGEKRAPLRQSLLDRYLNDLAIEAFYGDRAVLLTNRVASIVSPRGDGEVDLGGATLRRTMAKVVHLQKRNGGNHYYYASLIADERETKVRTYEMTRLGVE